MAIKAKKRRVPKHIRLAEEAVWQLWRKRVDVTAKAFACGYGEVGDVLVRKDRGPLADKTLFYRLKERTEPAVLQRWWIDAPY